MEGGGEEPNLCKKLCTRAVDDVIVLGHAAPGQGGIAAEEGGVTGAGTAHLTKSHCNCIDIKRDG